MAISAICQIKDGSGAWQDTPGGVNCTPGNTVTVRLVNAAGADVWLLTCVGTDENHVAATVTAGISVNALAKTATLTAPAAGSAYILRSYVLNAGTGAEAEETFKIATLTSGGLRVGATNETTENDPEHGSLAILNATIRKVDTLSGGVTYTLDSGSASLVAGDYVCLVGGTSATTVTKATAAALAVAGGALGIVTGSYAPGALSVLVYTSGTAPASVTGLGAGTATEAILVSARAARVPTDWSGNGYRAGAVDANGKVTINCRGRAATSPHHVINVKDHGVVGDAPLNRFGGGTDDYDAIQALFDALPADPSGNVGAPLYFPPGVYRVRTAPVLSNVARISGPSGSSVGSQGAWIVSDDGSAIEFALGASGTVVQHMGFAGKNSSYAPTFDFLAVGTAPGLNKLVVPSRMERGYQNVLYKVTTNAALATVNINAPLSGTVAVNVEPNWPGMRRSYISDPLYYGYADGVFANGSKILVETLVNTAVPYEYQASGGTTTAPGDPPDSRDFTTWAPSTVYATSTSLARVYRIPTSAFSGTWSFFECTTGGTSSGSEPSWNTTPSATTTDGTCVWTCIGTAWPRIVGKATTDGTITWTLTATSPTYSSGSCVFSPIFGVPVINIGGIVHLEHVSVDNAHGNGIDVVASAGDGTDANGFTLKDFSVSNTSGHGVRIRGADTNAGRTVGGNFLNNGGSAIADFSFLGNSHQAHQSAVCGGPPYQSTDPNSKISWLGNYTEGGQPPNRIKHGQVFGFLGADNFSADSNSLKTGTTNSAYAATITKKVAPWGWDPVSFTAFRYNGPSESSAIYYDPTTIVLNLNDYLVPNYDHPSSPASTGAGYLYRLTTCASGTTAPLTATQPTWPTTVGSTVNDGVGNIYTCVGRQELVISLGKPANLATPNTDMILDWAASDTTTHSNFQSNVIEGWDGFTLGGVPGNACLLFPNAKGKRLDGSTAATGFACVYNGLELGRGNALGRAWLFDSAAGWPTSTSGEVARVRWWTTGVSSLGYMGAVLVTSSGGGDTWRLFGKTVKADASGNALEEDFTAPDLKATGGTDVDTGNSLGDDNGRRFAKTGIASASDVIFHSYTPPDGAVVDVVAAFTVKQTAGTGNPKGGKFRTTIAVRRAGSAITVLDAATTSVGSANELAPTITVDTTTNAPRIDFIINTGDAAKTFSVWGTRYTLGGPTA